MTHLTDTMEQQLKESKDEPNVLYICYEDDERLPCLHTVSGMDESVRAFPTLKRWQHARRGIQPGVKSLWL